MSADRGSAPVEFVLGVCLLLLPTVMLVSVLPTWSARQQLAATIAREAARAYVVATSPADAARSARRAGDQVARAHGEDPAAFALRLTGRWARGATVTAEVRTTVPLTRVPLIGGIGRFRVVERHSEQRDPYRSA
jgi:hypothetical protein